MAQKIEFSLTRRGGRILADQLYASDFDTFRELAQNALGAHATRFTIDFVEDGRVCYISDNGDGMSSDFIRNQWGKIGERLENQMGFFGMGRLSVFKISDYVEVKTVSRSGEFTLIRWNDVMDADYDVSNSSLHSGTSYMLQLDRVINITELKDYLVNTIFLQGMSIFVNNERLALVSPKTGSEFISSRTDDYEDNSFNQKEYSFTVYLHPKMNEMVILEKGLKVKRDSIALGGYIDFSTPIKTASRGEVTIHSSSLRAIMAEAYVRYLPSVSRNERERLSEKILSLSESWMAWRSNLNLEQELQNFLVIDGKSPQEWKYLAESGSKILIYKTQRDDVWTERALQKGFTVLKVMNEKIFEILAKNGLQNLESIKLNLVEHLSHREGMSEEEHELLAYVGTYLDTLKTQMQISESPEARKFAPRGEIRGIAREISLTSEETSSISTDSEEISSSISDKNSTPIVATHDGKTVNPTNIVHIGEPISGGNLKVWFGTSTDNSKEDENALAWHVGGLKGGEIALNTSNPIISEILATKKFYLVKDIVNHEYAHELAKTFGHGEDFSQCLTQIQLAAIKCELLRRRGRPKKVE